MLHQPDSAVPGRERPDERLVPRVEDVADDRADSSDSLAAHFFHAAEASQDAPRAGDSGGGPRIPGYVIRTLIHAGGQACVYRATQTSTGQDVAIKVVMGIPWQRDIQFRPARAGGLSGM